MNGILVGCIVILFVPIPVLVMPVLLVTRHRYKGCRVQPCRERLSLPSIQTEPITSASPELYNTLLKDDSPEARVSVGSERSLDVGSISGFSTAATTP